MKPPNTHQLVVYDVELFIRVLAAFDAVILVAVVLLVLPAGAGLGPGPPVRARRHGPARGRRRRPHPEPHATRRHPLETFNAR